MRTSSTNQLVDQQLEELFSKSFDIEKSPGKMMKWDKSNRVYQGVRKDAINKALSKTSKNTKDRMQQLMKVVTNKERMGPIASIKVLVDLVKQAPTEMINRIEKMVSDKESHFGEVAHDLWARSGGDLAALISNAAGYLAVSGLGAAYQQAYTSFTSRGMSKFSSAILAVCICIGMGTPASIHGLVGLALDLKWAIISLVTPGTGAIEAFIFILLGRVAIYVKNFLAEIRKNMVDSVEESALIRRVGFVYGTKPLVEFGYLG